MSKRDDAMAILRYWAERFRDLGVCPVPIRIISNGYANNDNYSEDENLPSYAVFVGVASLGRQSLAPGSTHGHMIDQPIDEVCFIVWLNLETNEPEEIREPDLADLEIEKYYEMIVDIESANKNGKI
jgi:hypothetical protein